MVHCKVCNPSKARTGGGKTFRDFLRNSSSVVYESVQKELLSRLKSRNIKTNVKDDADDLYDTEYDDENDMHGFEKTISKKRRSDHKKPQNSP